MSHSHNCHNSSSWSIAIRASMMEREGWRWRASRSAICSTDHTPELGPLLEMLQASHSQPVIASLRGTKQFTRSASLFHVEFPVRLNTLDRAGFRIDTKVRSAASSFAFLRLLTRREGATTNHKAGTHLRMSRMKTST